MARGGSTVGKKLAHQPMVEGSNPTNASDRERERERERKRERERERN
jgi:hypothetical protein